MPDLFRFIENVSVFHSQFRECRESASRIMEENARLISRSLTAIERSRELLRQTDELVRRSEVEAGWGGEWASERHAARDCSRGGLDNSQGHRNG